MTWLGWRSRTIEQLRRLGEARPVTTYDIVDFATRGAAAVLCLLTPDEVVRPTSGSRRSEVRPRPNVIFEAGLAFARQPAKTLLVKVGKTRSWSDVDGVQYAEFSNEAERRDELVEWLASIGLPIDRKKGDWRTKDYGLPDYGS
jgi:predicted nucleotide-binding protein